MTSAGMEVRSVKTLIAALSEGHAAPMPTRILAHFEREDSRPECLQRCRECVQLFDALAFNKTLITLELRGAPPKEFCIAIAKAVARNTTLRTFCFIAYDHHLDNEIGLAIAAAVKSSATLQTFTFRVSEHMDNETGLALADAVKGSAMLQTFNFNATSTASMDNETGLALADAVKGHTTLKAFTFLAGTSMDDETGLAIADVLKGRSELRVFSFGDNGRMDREAFAAMAGALACNAALETLTVFTNTLTPFFVDALAEALLCNMTLLSCKVNGVPRRSCEACTRRNREARVQRHALTELARCSANTGFHSLKETVFRKKLLGYFLPSWWSLLPIEFVTGRGGGSPEKSDNQGRRSPTRVSA